MKKTMILGIVSMILLVSFSSALAVDINVQEQISKTEVNGWINDPIDNGVTNSIVIDSLDRPHISYYKNGDLMYAVKTGYDWDIQTVDSENNTGQYSSIALDSNDNPHISYIDKTNGDLKYAFKNGAEWSIETVDSESTAEYFTSIALDSSNCPHILYHDHYLGRIRYAFKNGDAWETEEVITGGSCGFLIIDSSDVPRIAFHNTMYGNGISYGVKEGSTWTFETIITATWSSVFSFALDLNNRPCVTYTIHSGEYLTPYFIFSTRTDAGWVPEVVDSEGGLGNYNSLAFDSENQPHVTYQYYDWDKDELRYAIKTAGVWIHLKINPDRCDWISSACDSNNKPHIIYTSNGFLWYATYENLPPYELTIEGPKLIPAKTEQTYTLNSIDLDNDTLMYYIDWGDNTNTGWAGPYNSDEEILFTHAWNRKGVFSIKTKVMDVHGAESDWVYLTVVLNKNKVIKNPIFNLLQFHPNLYKIIKLLFL